MAELTFEEFEEKYKPIKNPLNPGQGWDDFAFETYGEDLELVKSVPNEHIWTVMDCDGQFVVGNGFHFVNRFSYFITEVAHDENDCIEVIDEDDLLDGEIDD